jgi:hypothetical protein
MIEFLHSTAQLEAGVVIMWGTEYFHPTHITTKVEAFQITRRVFASNE